MERRWCRTRLYSFSDSRFAVGPFSLLYCLFPLPKSDQPFFPSRSGRREVGLHFVEEGWFVEKGL
jgi:hypothetical protein